MPTIQSKQNSWFSQKVGNTPTSFALIHADGDQNRQNDDDEDERGDRQRDDDGLRQLTLDVENYQRALITTGHVAEVHGARLSTRDHSVL